MMTFLHPLQTKYLGFCALVAALVLLFSPACSWALSDEELFIQAKAAFSQGDYPTAYRAFGSLIGSRPGDSDLDFYLGRSAFETGDFEAAIFAFERILIAHPDSDRSRLELARSYYRIGDLESARSYFNEVLEHDPPKNVQENIERFLAQIDRAQQRHTFGGMVSLTLSYDDNVRAAPAEETVATLLGSVTLSGQGSSPENDLILQPTFLLNHAYRSRPDAMSWQTSVVSYSALYKDEEDLDLNLLGITSGPVWQSRKWQAALMGSFNYLDLDSRRYLITAGLGLELTWAVHPYLSLGLGLNAADHNYAEDARDASLYRAEFKPGVVWGDNRATAGMAVELNEAHDDTTGYLRHSVSAGYERRLPYQVILSLGYRYRSSRYRETDPMFGEKRQDKVHEYSFGLTKPVWRSTDGGCQLQAQLNHLVSDANSNIQLYEYDKQVTSLGFTFLF